MPSRLLYLGCQPGQDVMDLQDGLNAVTALPNQASAAALLAVDGIFGGKTGARVREFQQRNGLGVDGVVGAQTWGALVGLLQAVPGLQIGRPVGGSGPGPAKGLDGEPVHGKVAGGGGKQDTGGGKSGSSGGGASKSGKQAGAGGTGPGGKDGGGGGHGGKDGGSGADAGGGKSAPPAGGGWAPWAGSGAAKPAWSPAYKGNYKSTTAGSGKSGGSSDAGGGGKGT